MLKIEGLIKQDRLLRALTGLNKKAGSPKDVRIDCPKGYRFAYSGERKTK
jgi:hypothetical protein